MVQSEAQKRAKAKYYQKLKENPEYKEASAKRTNEYYTNNKEKHIERRAWGPDEDEAIKKLVAKLGTKSWAAIAVALGREYNFMGKTAKQCRERWYNHLNPTLSKAPLTEHEERVLLESHRELGNKWAEIAKRLPGRSDNHVKNYWYSYMRREQKNNHQNINPTHVVNFAIRNPSVVTTTVAPQMILPSGPPTIQALQQQPPQPFIILKPENPKLPDDSDSEDERDVNLKKRQKV